MKRPEKKLVLESGQEFYGIGFGADCRRVCEIVFNTSVVGYQEIISDPSYAEQIVVMTYPLIGNYGITDEDFESRTPSIGGLVVRECCDTPSNFRYTKTLEEELEERGIPCLSGVDTRMLTKIIRDSGRPMAAIVEADMPLEEALALIAATERPEGLVRRVSCRKRWVTRTSGHKYHVVAVDCGIKYSIIRHLKDRGCNVTIVPFNASADDIMAFNPDGILLSNGPASAFEAPEILDLFSSLKGRRPILGIGLGMEAIGLEYGAVLKPMGCGVHGDHPVKDLATGRINIAVLNQSYRFDSVEDTPLVPTHVAVPEGYILGFENREDKVIGFQFHMESAPGPQDNVNLFDRFIEMMEDKSNA
ncbi:MAG: carbamoyl phosphate synthase small subunit [Bacteroidales bacterium]|jgi:carbamoyl-phosphate synthase small subunit|nr:carbamoyl phosphate synthase small subunit [Bacteroidales bacterium]